MTVWEGDKQSTDERFGIVVARFNSAITEKLLEGAMATLQQNGVDGSRIDVARVPGAWELPVPTQRLLEKGSYAAVICLGAVIRGETTHDQYINSQVSMSLGQLALQFRRPVLFGLLTCQTIEQAQNRAGGRVGNKGSDCAEAALEMVSLLRQMDSG